MSYRWARHSRARSPRRMAAPHGQRPGLCSVPPCSHFPGRELSSAGGGHLPPGWGPSSLHLSGREGSSAGRDHPPLGQGPHRRAPRPDIQRRLGQSRVALDGRGRLVPSNVGTAAAFATSIPLAFIGISLCL